MANQPWSRSLEWNVALQNEQLRREFWHKLFLARFVGETTVDDNGSKIPSGMPIEVLREAAQEGGDSILVPLLRNLSGAGVYNDMQLRGNEETQTLYFQKVYLNQIRHAVKSDGRMGRQRVKGLDLVNKFRPQLSDWFAHWWEWAFHYTLHNGYSPHVFKGTDTGGYNITSGQKICHPNTYVANSGFVTWSATAATYESSIDTDAGALTDTSTDHFTVALLEDLRVAVIEKKLKPMVTEDGFEFFPMLVHPHQLKQLRNESDWKAAQREANLPGKGNPIFSGAAGHYAGFVLYERWLTNAIDTTGAAGDVTYGNSTAYFGESALSNSDRKVATILGGGAIAHGEASGPYFDEDNFDYNNSKGVSVGMIGGSARGETKDDSTDGSNTAVINQSSIDVITFSDGS